MVIREILQTLINQEHQLIKSIKEPTPTQHPAVEMVIKYHEGRISGIEMAHKLITAVVEEKQVLSITPEIKILNEKQLQEMTGMWEWDNKQKPTDRDRLKQLFDDWGVEYDIQVGDKKNTLTTSERSSCKKVGGYVAFYTDFDFDKDGKFLEMGAYE